MKKIALGVNIDHAATLRQVRGATTAYPDLLTLAKISKKAGARQLTIHLREDRRHIQDADVVNLCSQSPLPVNLEMAVSYDMLKIAVKNKPKWVCFVPEKREELTTEGGLHVLKVFSDIKEMTAQLQKVKVKVSFFIEPNPVQVSASAEAGADAVEFHTGHWVLSEGTEKEKIWNNLVLSAEQAHRAGLRVHAGHGLDYHHARLIRKLPHLREVNIGHSLICYSIEDGLSKSIKKMLTKLR